MGEPPADHVMAVEIAEHKSAAMEEHDGRSRPDPGGERHVETRFQGSVCALHGQVRDLGQLWRIGFDGPAGAIETLAQPVRGLRPVEAREIGHIHLGQLDLIEEGTDRLFNHDRDDGPSGAEVQGEKS